MELMEAYELLKKATSIGEVITILRELKNTHNDVDIRILPIDSKDPLNSTYRITAKLGKDGWYLPTGRGVYDILKEVING